MKITNKHNLPDYLYKAMSKTYPPKPNRMSVTDLINPKIMRSLKIKHWDELEEDASDRLWMFFGTMGHLAMEQGADPNSLSEEKLEVPMGDLTLVGKFDQLNERGELVDFKFTSVWSFVLGDHKDWTNQLNIYAWMLHKHGFEAKSLRVDAILRDWSRSKVKDDYPRIAFQSIVVPLWQPQTQEEYIEGRLLLHRGKEVECSSEEKWERPTKYAVMKKGRKSALRVLDSESEARNWSILNNYAALIPPSFVPNTGISIVERPGECIRCESYCSVSEVCPYKKG